MTTAEGKLTGVRPALRGWLLVDDQTLAPRSRDLVVGLRIVTAVGTLTAVFLAVLPFFLSAAAVDGWGAVYGALAFALIMVLPLWIAPYAVWPKRTATVDDDILTFYTLISRRELDLRRVDRVWTRTFAGKGGVAVSAGLSGAGVPSALLSWDGGDGDHPAYLIARAAAARDGVNVSARARAALDLPGAPSTTQQFVYWIKGAVWFLAYCLIGTAAIIAYVNVLSGLPPWSR